MPQRGFTLLELLVVLVLVGMITGMVGPRFIDLAERLRHRNEWQTLQQRINGLPMEVQLTGRPMALQALLTDTRPSRKSSCSGASGLPDSASKNSRGREG